MGLLKSILASHLIFDFAGASPAFGLEDCPGVTLGAACPTCTLPWVYSNCKADNGGNELYFVMRLDSGDTVQSILNTGQLGLTPPPTGSVVNLGQEDADFGTHTKDMGVGYTGNCTEVDDAKSEKPAAIADHTYCGHVNVASGSVVAKATFNGTTFSDYSMKYDATPVTPITPVTPVPTLPLFGLGILFSLLGLFGLRRLRQ